MERSGMKETGHFDGASYLQINNSGKVLSFNSRTEQSSLAPFRSCAQELMIMIGA